MSLEQKPVQHLSPTHQHQKHYVNNSHISKLAQGCYSVHYTNI
jgi:hypothetical protein